MMERDAPLDDAPEEEAALGATRAYHLASTHRPEAYAPSPGFLDWDSQPDPFRRFAGAPPTPLPLLEGRGRCAYDALIDGAAPAPAPLDLGGLGLFFELSLGLSAWKRMGPDRWALRNNPSSGNLHPTEGYLLLWRACARLAPGLHHYAPHEHALERRARLPEAAAARLAEAAPGAFGAFGLSSILWREEWKYGARAYRYCQHDVGHALAAARLAAGVLGWRLTLVPGPSDAAIAACLGLDRAGDFEGAEPEHPDLLALIGEDPEGGAPSWAALAEALEEWTGAANRLSEERVRWPQIQSVLPAQRQEPGAAARSPETLPLEASPPAALAPEASLAEAPAARPAASPPQIRPIDACALIRQRRSAQRMDGETAMAWADFERLLLRLSPQRAGPPFDAFPYPPACNLLFFVHRVEGLAPGLYALVRLPEREAAFREACAGAAQRWRRVEASAAPLYALGPSLDARKIASQLSCYQGLGGRGAFSLGMIADFEATLRAEGAAAYRRLHWEAGMIGQLLYLEAEAAGLRGTGIGCFFDEAVGALVGLERGPEAPWRALYHFAVGAALDDARLTTEPPYAHLSDRQPIEGDRR